MIAAIVEHRHRRLLDGVGRASASPPKRAARGAPAFAPTCSWCSPRRRRYYEVPAIRRDAGPWCVLRPSTGSCWRAIGARTRPRPLDAHQEPPTPSSPASAVCSSAPAAPPPSSPRPAAVAARARAVFFDAVTHGGAARSPRHARRRAPIGRCLELVRAAAHQARPPFFRGVAAPSRVQSIAIDPPAPPAVRRRRCCRAPDRMRSAIAVSGGTSSEDIFGSSSEDAL